MYIMKNRLPVILLINTCKYNMYKYVFINFLLYDNITTINLL